MTSNWLYTLKKLVQFIINISVFMVVILMIITLFGLTNAIVKISTWGILTRSLFTIGIIFLLAKVTIYCFTTDFSLPIFSIFRKKTKPRKRYAMLRDKK